MVYDCLISSLKMPLNIFLCYSLGTSEINWKLLQKYTDNLFLTLTQINDYVLSDMVVFLKTINCFQLMCTFSHLLPSLLLPI